MRTKGVESVRSPVTTLKEWHDHVTHEKFVESVVREFRLDYDIDVDEEVCMHSFCTHVLRFPYTQIGALRRGK